MSLYRQADFTGSAYTRAHRVVCENPISGSGNPSVSFHEQRVVTSAGGGETLVQNVGEFRAEMTAANLGTEFPLVDTNGDPTAETMTYAQVYGVLQSLYMHLTQQRDQTVL